MNLTFSVPEGSTNHGSPHLFCKPPVWYDYIIFFFTNYIAHAATIVTLPGQGVMETTCVALAALLVPSSRIMRAMEIFIRRPVFKRDSLAKAAAARALCMVVRMRPKEDFESRIGLHSQVDSVQFPWMDKIELVHCRATIHGQSYLPNGYRFAYVPNTSALVFRQQLIGNTENGTTEDTYKILTGGLAASFNVSRAIISLVQAIWAIITLYYSRGNQAERYGYAAFGLTVAPYAYMSIINLAATCITSSYRAIYMVRTSLMREAESKGGKFVGEVADLDLGLIQVEGSQSLSRNVTMGIGLLLSFIPLIITSVLSRLQAGSSSTLQRGFTMAWLVTGIFGGILSYKLLSMLFFNKYDTPKYWNFLVGAFIFWVLIPLGVPALGGFVIVGQMPKEYGICDSLS